MSEEEGQRWERIAGELGELAERVGQWTAYLLSRGFDTREFLLLCDRVQRAVAAGKAPDVDPDEVGAQLADFIERLRSLPDFPPKFSDQEAKHWKMLSSALLLERQMEETLEEGKDFLPEPFLAMLKDLRAQLQQGSLTGKMPVEAIQDANLQTIALHAENERVVRFKNAAMAIYWSQMPAEKWESMDAAERGQLADLLRDWEEEARAKVFSELPLEDRRRLEAMEKFQPEDWEKPGVFDSPSSP